MKIFPGLAFHNDLMKEIFNGPEGGMAVEVEGDEKAVSQGVIID